MVMTSNSLNLLLRGNVSHFRLEAGWCRLNADNRQRHLAVMFASAKTNSVQEVSNMSTTETQSINIRGLSKTAYQHIEQQAKQSNMSINKYLQKKLELIAYGAGAVKRDVEGELAQRSFETIRINTHFRSLLYDYFPELQAVKKIEVAENGG